MDIGSAARHWAEEWAAAWQAADVPRVEALYAPAAAFRSHPFRDLQEPGAYAAWAFAEQEAARCSFGEPIVAGDRATVEWWAVVRACGRETTLAGVSLLRFRADGLVVDQRDYWAEAEGASEPYPGFGR